LPNFIIYYGLPEKRSPLRPGACLNHMQPQIRTEHRAIGDVL